jgi:hypothetical protein
MSATADKAKPAVSAPSGKDDLKTLPLPEVEKKLRSSPDGLTQAEAAKRLAQYGPNEIAEKKTNPLLKFLSYFWGPIPWMIEVAVVLSGVVRHWPDFFIILVLLVANATIGFWEERQAGDAIEALKAKLAIKARVKRDGKWITPAARELVPGDVIRVRLGDIVPADARLLDGGEVSVDQSALTGESLPASRKTGDAVFSGSIIRRGEVGALVYATGVKTYFGKTAELVETAVTVSHFQKAVLKIGDYLIMLAVVLVAVIIAVALYRGDPILTTLQFALVLTVAAIPVAMPTVLSVTMAVGARLLAKKQAIVSKLVAIEELAGVDVLCADKTGTLTQNKLTLGDPFCLDKVTADQLILAGALASRAENGDTIDLAVLGGLKDKGALKPYQVTHFQPFDPVHKRTEATVKAADGGTFKVTKGAPQVIQGLAANTGAVKDAVDKAVNDFAAKGFRALGVARTDGEGKWQFLGVLPLFDPPRDDAKSTVATARKMGVAMLGPAAQTGAQDEHAAAVEIGEPARAPEKLPVQNVAPSVVHPPAPSPAPPSAVAAVATVAPGSPVPASASPAATVVAAGKATVQLATVYSEAAGTYEWQRLQKRLPDLLGSREPLVIWTEQDGRAFWLLRTGGFADQSQAAAFCQRLHAKKSGCEVVAAGQADGAAAGAVCLRAGYATGRQSNAPASMWCRLNGASKVGPPSLRIDALKDGRRRLSRARVLGHRNLPAAVLYDDLAGGGTIAPDVPFPHARRRASESRQHALAWGALRLGIGRHRRRNDAGARHRSRPQGRRYPVRTAGAAH